MERWGETPNEKLVNKIANKISWNIWQMDGLRQTVPLGKPYEQFEQLSLFDIPSELSEKEKESRKQFLAKFMIGEGIIPFSLSA